MQFRYKSAGSEDLPPTAQARFGLAIETTEGAWACGENLEF